MLVTKHAKQRIEQRCNCSKKNAKRMARKAWLFGIPHKDLDGAICNWVNKLYLTQHHANNIKIYDKEAYLFKNQVLLTVIKVPKNCLASLEKTKQRLRDERRSEE